MALEIKIKKRLNDFTLDVEFTTEGETMALLGASGCGKSLTLRCIAGIDRPDEGYIILNNRVLYDSEHKIDLPPQKRHVGYLFQQFALFPNMSVKQNIMAGVKNKPHYQREKIVNEKIHTFHLDGLENKRPYQLSGGQQQRVALARILANEPELLLLDEPFTALDSYLKWQLELELLDTINSFGHDVLFVSHDRDEVSRICDTVCVLNGGKSEPKQTVKELFTSPRTLSACLLSGCKNFSRAVKLESNRILALDWSCELITENPVPEQIQYVGIRSHHLKLGNGLNAIQCRAEKIVHEPFSTSLILSAGQSKLRLDTESEIKIISGQYINVHVSPSDIMLLL